MRLVLPTALLALIVAAGCGGTKTAALPKKQHPAPVRRAALTKEQYKARLTATLRPAAHAVGEIFRDRPGDSPEIVYARATAARKALKRAADMVKGLTPPEGLEGVNGRLAAGLEAYSREIELATSALLSRDPTVIANQINAMKGPKTIQRALKELRRRGYEVVPSGVNTKLG